MGRIVCGGGRSLIESVNEGVEGTVEEGTQRSIPYNNILNRSINTLPEGALLGLSDSSCCSA